MAVPLPELPAARRPVGRAEVVAWVAIAAVTGAILALLDKPPHEYESGLLVFLLAGFWLALPGRAPVAWIAIACGVGPILANYFSAELARRGTLVVPSLVAIAVGALVGRIAGRRLELSPSVESEDVGDRAWFLRPLDVRTLLALALSAVVALSLTPVWRMTVSAGWDTGLAEIRRWQAYSFLLWVLAAKTVVGVRKRIDRWLARRAASTDGLTPLGASAHAIVIAGFTLVHAAILATLTRLSPRAPPRVAHEALAHIPTIFAVYLPFDLLAYTAILGLAWIADTERQARESRQRATALQADALASRLSALRARLDPHFLYNTLNSAVVLARAGRGAETSRVLEDITGLLRYVLDEREELVPLARELEFVRRYADIQSVRFGDMLRFAFSVSDGAAARPVPRLVLQPLVENAVEHGARGDDEPLAIRVRAFVEHDAVVLQVDDDGDGVSPHGPSSRPGIGLGHTRERLAALYGERARVTLAPLAPRGTRAEVRLPA